MIRFAIPKREPLLVEHERFRDAVEGKESDIVTLRQGMRTVEVAEAVLQSATSGVTVSIPASR
jgi:predicted dehydrogenase